MSLFSFGGCVYRYQVHAKHAGSLATMASLCASMGDMPQMASIDYMHTSNLPGGRCKWLRAQIADRTIHWAVSADSDTEWQGGHLLKAMQYVHGDVAIGVAPVVIGGTEDKLNIVVNGSRASEFWLAGMSPGRVIPIEAGGFGLVVFNLKWFRRNWQWPQPELHHGDTAESGEDINFCASVTKRGGKIIAIPVPTTHHSMVGTLSRSIGFVDGIMAVGEVAT